VSSSSTLGPYTAATNSQIVLNNNRLNLTNKLDVVSETYFNSGFSNYSLSVKSRSLPS